MSAEPYRPAPVNARVATADDLESVVETLALAFYRDPVWSWAFAEPERRLEQHRVIWGLVAAAALEYGSAWLTDGCASVALWIPPGLPELRPQDEQRLEPLIVDLLGDGAGRVLDTFERFDAAHPEAPPHHYLSLLGTQPSQAGRGTGMGLLADNLARIDAEGTPAYLESSNPANDHRYERLGFVRWGEFDLGEDGPTVTQMWRDPR